MDIRNNVIVFKDVLFVIPIIVTVLLKLFVVTN